MTIDVDLHPIHNSIYLSNGRGYGHGDGKGASNGQGHGWGLGSGSGDGAGNNHNTPRALPALEDYHGDGDGTGKAY